MKIQELLRKLLINLFIFMILMVQSLQLPTLAGISKSTLLQAPQVKADYAYAATSASVTTGTQLNDVQYVGAADNSYWRTVSTGSGLDATVTFSNVSLASANKILVHYDGLVSSATLTYQIQIRDFTNSTWRNLVPHETTLANTADSTVVGQVLYELSIYDGYISNGSNGAVSTPMSYFVNGSNEVQIRFLNSGSTAGLELAVDYLSVEPVIDTQRTASSMTNTAGGTVTNEYNDTTTDDNTTSLQIAANGSGIDAYLSFTNLPTPYTGANTILVEFSGLRTTITNYTVSIRDFTNSQWDTLSGTALTNTSDATNYFASSIAQSVTDYVSSGEIRIRVSSASTSGSVTIDYARVTIGSVASNTGIYVGTITRGTTSTGTVANTQTLDTSSADSAWVLNTTNTTAATTTEYNGDCNTAANHCVALNIQMPVTLPSNTLVTGVYVVQRHLASNAALDQELGIFDERTGRVAITPTTGVDDTTAQMRMRTIAYAMPPQIGSDPITTIPVYQPQQAVDTTNNSIQWYSRTTASDTTARTLTLDFVFSSIRYIGPEKSVTATWVPTGSTLTQGTVNASNWRFANQDDAGYYTITANATNGTDIYLSFSNVTIPTGSNKLLIYSQHRWSVASTVHELYIWDFIGSTWREITPHDSTYTSSGVANTEQLYQLEIYDGYFDDGSNAPVTTALSNFVSGGEVRLRYLSANTTSGLGIDYAFVEFSKDPTYFANSMSITNGTRTNQYSDTFTDDATTNLIITNSSGIDYYFAFKNVITPPTGSNAAYVTYSGFHTGATSYNVYIRNFTSASWELLNSTALTNTADATNSFLKSITTWSDYISSGEMRIRVATTAAAGSANTDFVRLILGSVNTAGSGSAIRAGGEMQNTVTQARDLDTSVTFAAPTHAWRLRNYESTMSNRTFDGPANISFSIDFPMTLPTNSYPMQITLMHKGAVSVATLNLTPTFVDKKNYYADAVNIKADQGSLTSMPTAVNIVSIAATAQNIRDGWYVVNVPNSIDTTDNEIRLRLRSSSAPFTETYVDLDTAFVALKYVN